MPMPPVLRPERPLRRPLDALAARFGLGTRGVLAGLHATGVTLSTADIREGEVFVAIGGRNAHGARYAAEAARRGAVAVLTDEEGATIASDSGLPVLVTESPRGVLGAVSAWFYGTDEPGLVLYATTGTNGKTSTSHLLEGVLRQAGYVTGLSSTAERHIGDLVITSRLTTPEASEMHALLARMREAGVEQVAVEVSAQALSRQRVDGLRFDVAGFTNLSHDHLDDYADLEEYLTAKVALFQPDRAERGVVSLDSPAGAEVVRRAGIPVATVASGPAGAVPDADWRVEFGAETPESTAFALHGPYGSLASAVPIIGTHMAANAGLAIAMAASAGVPFARIRDALDGRHLDAYLPGRTERVSGRRGPTVYVDFGHSPDAFAKTLAAVRRVTTGRTLMLFGADGDRDATKRYDMAKEAVLGSDVLVITDHHPRFEDPDSIRATLEAAAREVRPDGEISNVSPPEAAIRHAVSLVGEGDSILWAGPGHQDYRDIRGQRTVYSAKEEARRALAEAGWEPAPARSSADHRAGDA